MQEIKVRLTFTEEILGTAAADKEIHKTYIASLAPNAPSKKEEVEAVGVEETIEKAMTVFPRNKEGVPIYWDYQIKGFFKDAAGMLRKVPNTKSSKIKAYKKEIDGLIFVKERQIPIHFDGEIGNCERPLPVGTNRVRRNMEETTWEQAEGFAVSVIREARIKAKFWFAAWLVTFVVLITVVAAVLVM